MMCPEWAFAGTVTISPPLVLRRCAAGELRLTCAPGVFGNPTAIPLASPTPWISRVPWRETWCGFPLQRVAGVQLTLVIRTFFTCRDATAGVLLGAEAPVVGAAWVPPALAALALAGGWVRASTSSTVTA